LEANVVFAEESVVSRATELMEAELGDEMVALDVQQGLCLGLNAPATSVWRLTARPLSVGELKSALGTEYSAAPEELSADLQDLLGEMVSRGMISIR
jgi:hypothetical protein